MVMVSGIKYQERALINANKKKAKTRQKERSTKGKEVKQTDQKTSKITNAQINSNQIKYIECSCTHINRQK